MFDAVCITNVYQEGNRTTFKCRLSVNVGASNYWKPVGLSRPVKELYLLAVINCFNKNSYDYLRCSIDHEGGQNDINIKLTTF